MGDDTTVNDHDQGDTPERCDHCGARIAEDGDCDACQRAWERGEVLA